MLRQPLWRKVKELNTEGRLALFLGAGVSIGCGLPNWSDLVSRVVTTTWKEQPELARILLENKNILAASRYARQKAGSNFNRIVHEALYTGDVMLSKCIWAIARSGVRNICTFNFDDLLAEAILTEGLECVIATPDESFQSTNDGVTIYHPHGILPRLYRDGELDQTNIVFSEDDYHNLYTNQYSWANIAQMSLLTSKSVLFIGLSMQDPNLRRLIDIARSRGFTNQHFAIFQDPNSQNGGNKLKDGNQLRKLIEIDLHSLGITPWFIDRHDKLPELIKAISNNFVKNTLD